MSVLKQGAPDLLAYLPGYPAIGAPQNISAIIRSLEKQVASLSVRPEGGRKYLGTFLGFKVYEDPTLEEGEFRLQNDAQLTNEMLELEKLFAPSPLARIGWQSIETAPKDGTEVFGYRKDAGVFLIRWTSPESFCTDEELGALGDSGYVESWWYADFVAGGRLEGSEIPTHWMPLPEWETK